MYYKLIAGQDFFELNPGLRVVPAFKDLTDMQMKYICLVCDPSHDNPVRTLQGKTKREKAAVLAGYKLETDGKRLAKQGREIVDGKNRNIEAGIVNFKALHYDEKTDTYESINNQIGQIRDFLKSKQEDPIQLKRGLLLGAQLPELVEAKQKLERLLGVNQNNTPQLEETFTTADFQMEEPEEVTDNQPQSILDRFMMNKRTIN